MSEDTWLGVDVSNLTEEEKGRLPAVQPEGVDMPPCLVDLVTAGLEEHYYGTCGCWS